MAENGATPKVVGQVTLLFFDNQTATIANVAGNVGPWAMHNAFRALAGAIAGRAAATEAKQVKVELPPPGFDASKLRNPKDL